MEVFLTIYAIVAVVTFVAGALAMYEPNNDKQDRLGAMMLLAAPVWPLAVLYLVVALFVVAVRTVANRE